jgi:flavodoxin I
MKALVIYDSAYGNTQKIAQSIGGAINENVKVIKANQVNLSDLESLDFLFIGSPTYGGRPTPALLEFMKTLSEKQLKGLNVATFDTRIQVRIVKIFGFAAGKIAADLKAKGALIQGSEGFFVEKKEGPLSDGELERAAGWTRELVKSQILQPG